MDNKFIVTLFLLYCSLSISIVTAIGLSDESNSDKNLSTQKVVFKDDDSQWLIITPNPANCNIYLNNAFVKTGTFQQKLKSGTYSYKVEAPRYFTEEGKVVISTDKKVISVQLKPQFGVLHLTAPEEAVLFINDQKINLRSWKGELDPGIYNIEAQLNNHIPVKQQIVLEAGETKELIIKPQPVCGSLDVITEPIEASVEIDGKVYGKTPITINNLTIGSHKLKIGKQGYDTLIKSVTICQDSNKMINEVLSKGLKISIDSYGESQLYIDNKYIGKTPCSIRLFGTHILSNYELSSEELKDEFIGFDDKHENSNEISDYCLIPQNVNKLVEKREDILFNIEEIKQYIISKKSIYLEGVFRISVSGDSLFIEDLNRLTRSMIDYNYINLSNSPIKGDLNNDNKDDLIFIGKRSGGDGYFDEGEDYYIFLSSGKGYVYFDFNDLIGDEWCNKIKFLTQDFQINKISNGMIEVNATYLKGVSYPNRGYVGDIEHLYFCDEKYKINLDKKKFDLVSESNLTDENGKKVQLKNHSQSKKSKKITKRIK